MTSWPVWKLCHIAAVSAVCLIMSGHWPAAARAGSEEQAAADRMRAKFPTASVAAFVFRGAWDQLAPGAARLACFVTPRQLRASGDPGDGSTDI
jgi:phosphohistidine phosphatase SixA